jgi:hypothetical protein
VVSAIGRVGPCPMLLIRCVRRSSRAPSAAANRRRGYRSGAPATLGSASPPTATHLSRSSATCTATPVSRPSLLSRAANAPRGHEDIRRAAPFTMASTEGVTRTRNTAQPPERILVAVLCPSCGPWVDGPGAPWKEEGGIRGKLKRANLLQPYCNRPGTRWYAMGRETPRRDQEPRK